MTIQIARSSSPILESRPSLIYRGPGHFTIPPMSIVDKSTEDVADETSISNITLAILISAATLKVLSEMPTPDMCTLATTSLMCRDRRSNTYH